LNRFGFVEILVIAAIFVSIMLSLKAFGLTSSFSPDVGLGQTHTIYSKIEHFFTLSFKTLFNNPKTID